MQQTQSLGPGAQAAQVYGSNNTVTISGDSAELVLELRHKRKAEPTKPHHLLLADWRATELRGRAGDIESLKEWLAAPDPISVHCLIGGAGVGKTRIGIELCEQAGPDWTAGFIRYDELQRFFAARNLTGWAWPQPTLIVVDYAAASLRALRAARLAGGSGAALQPAGPAQAALPAAGTPRGPAGRLVVRTDAPRRIERRP